LSKHFNPSVILREAEHSGFPFAGDFCDEMEAMNKGK